MPDSPPDNFEHEEVCLKYLQFEVCVCGADRAKAAYAAGLAEGLRIAIAERVHAPFVPPGKHAQNCRAFVIDNPAAPTFNACSCHRYREWLAEEMKR